MRLTIAKTKSVSWCPRETREERTDMTADAVRPVRMVRFAVMNLFESILMKVKVLRAANVHTFPSFRCLLRWFSSILS